ncbi:MAG: translation initiation factor IF-1 [Roseibacillus sp.]|jgi:translation initiation factor IF-1|nr:translation initiation factor IF-1 [Roseibacillus sp.]MCP4729593.1 translation initiation factor IF-1 [Roseibacillus sp.]MDP6207712.1 translation initiation factor IF-1 [Roseibacillus sp.]MDP7306310.1 translation initiation factor IF-1 [Roseibacillus sp.]MDP7655109.1 translation initiation factor IF-1 [Roseibacillus sp.]|tara:strand:+ start:17826 stop:18053 length:228 start_codon:yes stop_codon:yes gene_type:complete
MSEPPIVTTGVIREVLPDSVFRVELPNGKLVIGHLPGRLAGLAEELVLSGRVHLEMTPFDFEKARIVGPVKHSDE